MTQKYKAGKATLKNLDGVHPDLVAAVLLAFKYTEQDFCIIENGGVRSASAAAANAKAGVGVANSLHIKQADGYGHAVDLVAYQNGAPSWDQKLYPAIRDAMIRACDELRLPIQHGADWDMDGITGEKGEWDWPHFQLPRYAHKKEVARKAMEDRLKARAGS